MLTRLHVEHEGYRELAFLHQELHLAVVGAREVLVLLVVDFATFGVDHRHRDHFQGCLSFPGLIMPLLVEVGRCNFLHTFLDLLDLGQHVLVTRQHLPGEDAKRDEREGKDSTEGESNIRECLQKSLRFLARMLQRKL